jgi:hypothetical protein
MNSPELGIGRKYRTIRVFQGYDLLSGTIAATRAITGQYTVAQFTLLDDCRLEFAVPEGFVTSGTSIRITMRWQCNEAYALRSASVNWRYIWAACPSDGTELASAPTDTGTGTTGNVAIPTLARQHKETTICTIPAASVASTDTISLSIQRIAVTGGLEPIAEPELVTLRVRMPELYVLPENVI